MDTSLLALISKSLSDAIARKNESAYSINRNRSSLFVSELAKNLSSNLTAPDCTLKVISVDSSGKRLPGEWLLDIAITRCIKIEETGHVENAVTSIEWAVESESNSALSEFASDFSKLAVIRASNYLYMCGFNQGTERGAHRYFKRRLEFATNILKAANVVPPAFYVAFWPSPEKRVFKSYVGSLWDLIDDNSVQGFAHLKQVYLYQLTSEQPILIGATSIDVHSGGNPT